LSLYFYYVNYPKSLWDDDICGERKNTTVLGCQMGSIKKYKK
jgi:hypothetical protein